MYNIEKEMYLKNNINENEMKTTSNEKGNATLFQIRFGRSLMREREKEPLWPWD